MKQPTTITAAKDGRRSPEYREGLYLKESHSQKSFLTYAHGENSVYNAVIILLVFVQFIVFKQFYPSPDFFSDSYSYIFGAYAHLDVNIWPIGYSKFLLLFHWFTTSALVLNCFQYLFLEISALYFYHSIVYFYPTGKTTRTILCLFLFFNPLNLYLANYVSSDAIFIGLSLIWLSQMIWILHRPNLTQVILQALVFIIAFTFRYNAMYYPLITAGVLFLSRSKPMLKIAGSLIGPALALCFILFSRQASFTLLGSKQFPPILGGWQWANNALYMRDYIAEDSTAFPTKETAELDRIARTYFRTTPEDHRELSSYVANFFIRQPEAPLKQYLVAHYKMDDEIGQVVGWGQAATVFGQYGLFLIKRHPIAFFEHYMLLNTKNYFLPPLEKLEIYNLGEDHVAPIAGYWFHLGTTKVWAASKTIQGYILLLFPCLFLLFNFYYITGLVQFFKNRLYKTASPFTSTTYFIAAFMLLNFVFSVFANIIVIRYQVFPMIVCLSFGCLLTDYLESVKHPSPTRTPAFTKPEAQQALNTELS